MSKLALVAEEEVTSGSNLEADFLVEEYDPVMHRGIAGGEKLYDVHLVGL